VQAIRLTAALLALAAARVTPAQQPAARGTTGTRVVMLGTGTPNADPDRSGPAVAIVVNGQAYLVDAGPGIVRRAAAAAAAHGDSALVARRLDVVFLTHLHSDHTLGLPDLMLSPWVLERTAPLRVFGPPGTRAMVEHLGAAYSADVDTRLNGGEPSNRTGWRAEPREVDAGEVYRDANVTVTAFRVPHGGWPVALGYRFRTADRTIVVSGDTGPSDAVVTQCGGCDVLLHEVRSDARLATRPPAWQAYHRAFHTSTAELAALATRARPKLLVLYHQLYWGATDDDLLREVRARYAGPVVSARDLGVY
jgi:ribonuclease BN (tRNA processing enzyme)